MKNRIFEKGFFKESLKQNSAISIIIAALYAIITFFLIYSDSNFVYPYDDGAFYDPILIFLIVPFISAALLTLFSLGFTEKRKTRDFYGALPYSKKSMLFSSLAAVLVHITVPVIAFIILGPLAYGIFYGWENIYLIEQLKLTAIILSGCLFSMASALAGIVLTGKRGTGLLVSILLTCLPTIFAAQYMDHIYLARYGVDAFFLFPVNSIWLTGEYLTLNEIMASVPVTLFYAAVLFCIAIPFFIKLRFDRPAFTKYTKTIFIILCVMPLTSIVAQQGYFELTTIIAFIGMVVAAVIGIIINKRADTVLPIIAYGIAIMLSIIISVSCSLISSALSYDTYKVKEFKFDVSAHSYNGDKEYYTNAELNILDYTVTNEYVLEIINRNVNDYSDAPRKFIPISVDLGLTTANMHIRLTEGEFTQLKNALIQDKDFIEAYFALEAPNDDLIINGSRDEKHLEIYKTFYDEFNGLSLKNKCIVLTEPEKNVKSAICLTVLDPDGSDAFYSTYYITNATMPKTYALLK